MIAFLQCNGKVIVNRGWYRHVVASNVQYTTEGLGANIVVDVEDQLRSSFGVTSCLQRNGEIYDALFKDLRCVECQSKERVEFFWVVIVWMWYFRSHGACPVVCNQGSQDTHSEVRFAPTRFGE